MSRYISVTSDGGFNTSRFDGSGLPSSFVYTILELSIYTIYRHWTYNNISNDSPRSDRTRPINFFAHALGDDFFIQLH